MIHIIALEEKYVYTAIVYQALVEESGIYSGLSNICVDMISNVQ